MGLIMLLEAVFFTILPFFCTFYASFAEIPHLPGVNEYLQLREGSSGLRSGFVRVPSTWAVHPTLVKGKGAQGNNVRHHKPADMKDNQWWYFAEAVQTRRI